MSKQKGDESAFGVAAGSAIPFRLHEQWGVGYTKPGEDFFLTTIFESEEKASREAELRNLGPRRFSWETDMVWSVKHYPAAACENCGGVATKITEDGIKLCPACYALCPEDDSAQNNRDEPRGRKL